MAQAEAVERPGPAPARWLRVSRDFLVSVRAELGKVTWPTQDELIKATRVVVIAAGIVGVLLGLLDLLLTKILIDGIAAIGR